MNESLFLSFLYLCNGSLDDMVMFWLQVEPPCTPASIKIDSRSKFDPKILSEEDDMEIEIRHYPRYRHVEFDTYSTIKIVTKRRKPLQKSHTKISS